MRHIFAEMDSQDRNLGSGWISGMASVVLAGIGLSTVLCLLYPQFLTVTDLRGYYQAPIIRALLQLVLITAFALGVISITLRQNNTLGFAGMLIVLFSTLLGGSRASARITTENDVYFGLDFFLLNLIFLGVLFVPIERLLKKRDQPIFRPDWREDLFYFFVSSLFVQSLAYLSLTPATSFVEATSGANGVRQLIASQPLVLQFFEIMFVTDLVQYWFHRACHEIPWLWRFHAVHHSARYMDWIAGSRMHVFEIVLLRAFTTLPMYLMGFASSALYAYIFFVYLSSVFVHSNIRTDFGFLRFIFATPRFHHWHHGIDNEAININYAVHFPLIDRLFGTYHFPKDLWPDGYGIADHPVPHGYWRQFLYPFQTKPEADHPHQSKEQR